MSFIESFSINSQKKNPFPFNVLAVQLAKEIEVDNKVTIFVGDNGCGKSTLLESIAMSVNLPLIGGYINEHAGFEAARILQPHLDIQWKRKTNKGFFLQGRRL